MGVPGGVGQQVAQDLDRNALPSPVTVAFSGVASPRAALPPWWTSPTAWSAGP